jgi:hypothetical protein
MLSPVGVLCNDRPFQWVYSGCVTLWVGHVYLQWMGFEPCSHMTVDFMNNYMNEYCRGHIYTVDDDWGVPQRLMLIGERQHMRDNDHQSPQLWWAKTKKLEKSLDLMDEIDRFIFDQWAYEVILFDINRQFDINAMNRTYAKRLDDIDGSEFIRWGCDSEIIILVRESYVSQGKADILFHLTK